MEPRHPAAHRWYESSGMDDAGTAVISSVRSRISSATSSCLLKDDASGRATSVRSGITGDGGVSGRDGEETDEGPATQAAPLA